MMPTARASATLAMVITATNSYAQRYDTVFADAFIKAMTATDADADKNGRISVLEAFNYASRLVAQHYEQTGHLSTEHAVYVPAAAVATIANGQSSAVYVIDGSIAHVRVVQTAESDNGMVRIQAGLDEHAVVATSGLRQLFDGAKVRTSPASAQTPGQTR